MSKIEVLVVAAMLALAANAQGQSKSSTPRGLPQLVATCNDAATSGKPRDLRACETLEAEGRLSLAEPAAVTAYQRYRQERLAACQRRQASPRGQSRPADCD